MPHQGRSAPRRHGLTLAYSGDDRTALALLLLPFMIVALSLAIGQARRTSDPAVPGIIARAPLLEPIPAAPMALTPHLPATRSISYPPPTPVIDIASLQAVPPAAVPGAAAAIDVPGPVPPYPRRAPEIPLPAIAAAAPAPVMPAPVMPAPAIPAQAIPAPATALTYPLTAPDIDVASLDVRPPLPADATPLPPPYATREQVCQPPGAQLASFSSIGRRATVPRRPLLTGVDAATFGQRLSEAAVAQTRDLVIYTARYQAMAYPMGDVVALHGACIDVIIRAYRALGIDLQEEVQRGRSRRGDTNIEHRRTANVRSFLARQGASLPVTSFPEDYKPGDIVTYHRPFSRVSTSHIAIVSDILAPTGRPMIVHNRGYGVQLEDGLFVDRITGHYRYAGKPSATAAAPAPQPAAPPVRSPVVRASFPSGAGPQ